MPNKITRIGIYAHASSPASSVAGLWDVFSVCRQLLAAQGHTLEIDLIGAEGEHESLDGPISIRPTAQIGSDQYELIIIAAIGSPPRGGFSFDNSLLSWLSHCQSKGIAIASVCTGAFLLASTGLLDQRKATTHWKHAGQFRQQFPQVKLQIEQMLTHDGNLFCSGGAYAYHDLCLYLIELFFGQTLAQTCSKLLMIDPNKRTQLTFAGIQAYKAHTDEQVRNIQTWMEQNLESIQSVEELAEHFNMSLRNFVRRFKGAANTPPSNYLQRLKIEKAKHLLRSGNLQVEAIARQVGYSDTQYFRTLFKKTCGQTPSQFRLSQKSKSSLE